MQYITKEMIDRYFGDKSIIEVQSLVRLLEKDFGTSAFAIEQSDMNKDQINKMTKAIFSNKDILDQLNDARQNRDKDFSYYSGDELEFDKLVDEVNNDK